MIFCNLWIRFLGFCLLRCGAFRTPSEVEGREILARELYSGHLNKRKDRLVVNAFLPDNAKKLSLNRQSLAPRELFAALAMRHLRKRRIKNAKLSFYGFAELRAGEARAVVIDGARPLQVLASPILANPFHADVILPQDSQKDLQLDIARHLIKRAQYFPMGNRR